MIALSIAWLLAFSAVAGVDVALEIERGRLDLAEERTVQARRHAMAALEAKPDSWQAYNLYFDACVAAGLTDRVVVELDAAEREVPDWQRAISEMRGRVEAGDAEGVIGPLRELYEAHPGRPDLMSVLWIPRTPGRKVLRERERVLRDVERRAEVAGLVYLYRARRLYLTASPEAAQEVTQTLRRRGEAMELARAPWTRHERDEAARAMSIMAHPELPLGYPSEMLDVVRRLTALQHQGGNDAGAVEAWAQLRQRQDHAWSAALHAAALVEIGAWDRALSVGDEALLLGADPWSSDLTAANRPARTEVLSTALEVRARALFGANRMAESLRDLALANLLAGEAVNPALERELHKGIRPFFDELRRELAPRGESAGRVRLRAAQILAAGHADVALQTVDGSIALSAATMTGVGAAWAATMADAFELRARALMALERFDDARASLGLAWHLTEAPPASWVRLRAQLFEQADHPDAAFAAYALASAMGAEVPDDALSQTWIGAGDWRPVLDAIDVPAAAVAATPEPRAPAPRRSHANGGARAPSESPIVGQIARAWSVTTPYGVLSSQSTRGRTVMLAFWQSDCRECLQMLASLGRLARTLRKEGRDVVMVAVSADESQARFDELHRMGQYWGELVRDPELVAKMGVSSLPTMMIIDIDGVVRYHADTWQGPYIVELTLRRMLSD